MSASVSSQTCSPSFGPQPGSRDDPTEASSEVRKCVFNPSARNIPTSLDRSLCR
ncbi:unnamed protein product [Dicrocoelium dendriticum]|nr:unnamed protein product [Dicrocoelium dendriticum]